jgi:3-deoxy-D-manno-octulosonic-acid transferase
MPSGIIPRIWAGAATAAAPGLRCWLLLRLRRRKEVAGRLAERRGHEREPRPAGRLIWLHAASVGETMSILPVLAALQARAPALNLLVTTGTVTSAELLASRLTPPGRVLHRFVPLDVPAWARRFLDHWRPDAAVFVESELWPNLLDACRRRRIPLMLVNARLSARSFARWARVPGFARHVLGGFTLIQAQSEADAARLRNLGARAVTAPGNLKFAALPLPVDAAMLADLRQRIDGRPVWLAASTHPGEEALVFAAHRTLAAAHPGLLTIVAPRHPDRGARLATEAGDLALARRGAGEGPPDQGVWLADTLGEMGLWYRLARIAFVGRSLLPPGGGQNPLEPARLGCAIAVGPHTGNFTAVVQTLAEGGALHRLQDAAGLACWVDAMLRDPDAREVMGLAAAALASRYADLPDRTAAALLDLLPVSSPDSPAGRHLGAAA